MASIARIPISTASFIITIGSMIFNAYLDSVKIRNRKLQDFINITILLYEKEMKKDLQDNIINEQEQKELKDIYTHYLNKKMIWKNQDSSMLKKYLNILLEKWLKKDFNIWRNDYKTKWFFNETSKTKNKTF